MKRVRAIFNMGWRLGLHLGRKALAAPQAGKAEFLERYADDRLYPLSPEARRSLSRLESCICCGLCDTVCPKLDSRSRHRFNGPSALACSLTRSLPDYVLLDDFLRHLELCGDCKVCEEVCPVRVPLRELVAFARAARG